MRKVRIRVRHIVEIQAKCKWSKWKPQYVQVRFFIRVCKKSLDRDMQSIEVLEYTLAGFKSIHRSVNWLFKPNWCTDLNSIKLPVFINAFHPFENKTLPEIYLLLLRATLPKKDNKIKCTQTI